jgi:Na+-driven multidrug efflux pump
MAAVLAFYLASGRSLVCFTWARPQARLFGEILRVGAVASVTTLQTTLTVALTTAMVGAQGGPAAVAGYGTGNRLEYLMIPLVFGFGAPLVALVGTNLGAGRRERALRIAFTGATLAFVLTETVGLLAALSPESWLGLFSTDPEMHDVGAQYLRIVGPAYGFFGMGLALYFASQGAGRLLWPLLAGLIRLAIAIGAGWIALAVTGSLAWLFAALALALIAYGLTIAGAVARGAWFRPRRATR